MRMMKKLKGRGMGKLNKNGGNERGQKCGVNDNIMSGTAVQGEAVTGIHPFKERRRADFFDVIRSTIAINTSEQFCAWARNDLQYIFPHGMLLCGLGEIEHLSVRAQHLIACNFPKEYLHAVQQADGLITSPIISKWIATKRPVLFEIPEQHGQSAWLRNFIRFGLQNMAAHGQCDQHGRSTSYFCFTQIQGQLTARRAMLLELLVPHMHAALIRVFNITRKTESLPETNVPALSRRESEILSWMSAGKSNWEISKILQISENTVRNHVQNILVKLRVNSRTQAVANTQRWNSHCRGPLQDAHGDIVVQEEIR